MSRSSLGFWWRVLGLKGPAYRQRQWLVRREVCPRLSLSLDIEAADRP